MATEIETIAAMAREAEWIGADSCAFLLGMINRKGEVNRRGFLERIATRDSFPRPATIAGVRKWRRKDVALWAEDEARLSQRAA